MERTLSRSLPYLPRYQSLSPARSPACLSSRRVASLHSVSTPGSPQARVCYIDAGGAKRLACTSYRPRVSSASPSPSRPPRNYKVHVFCPQSSGQRGRGRSVYHAARVTRSLSAHDLNSSHVYAPVDDQHQGAGGRKGKGHELVIPDRAYCSCLDISHPDASESGVSVGGAVSDESVSSFLGGTDYDYLETLSQGSSSAFYEATFDSEPDLSGAEYPPISEARSLDVLYEVDLASGALQRFHQHHPRCLHHQSANSVSGSYNVHRRRELGPPPGDLDRARQHALRVFIPGSEPKSSGTAVSATGKDATRNKPSSHSPLAQSTPHVSPRSQGSKHLSVKACWNADDDLSSVGDATDIADTSHESLPHLKHQKSNVARTLQFVDLDISDARDGSSCYSSQSEDNFSDISSATAGSLGTGTRKTRFVKRASDKPSVIKLGAVGDCISSTKDLKSDTSREGKHSSEAFASLQHGHDSGVNDDGSGKASREQTELDEDSGSPGSSDWQDRQTFHETQAQAVSCTFGGSHEDSNEDEGEEGDGEGEDEEDSVKFRSVNKAGRVKGARHASHGKQSNQMTSGDTVTSLAKVNIPLISAGKHGQEKLRKRHSQSSPPPSPNQWEIQEEQNPESKAYGQIVSYAHDEHAHCEVSWTSQKFKKLFTFSSGSSEEELGHDSNENGFGLNEVTRKRESASDMNETGDEIESEVSKILALTTGQRKERVEKGVPDTKEQSKDEEKGKVRREADSSRNLIAQPVCMAGVNGAGEVGISTLATSDLSQVALHTEENEGREEEEIKSTTQVEDGERRACLIGESLLPTTSPSPANRSTDTTEIGSTCGSRNEQSIPIDSCERESSEGGVLFSTGEIHNTPGLKLDSNTRDQNCFQSESSNNCVDESVVSGFLGNGSKRGISCAIDPKQVDATLECGVTTLSANQSEANAKSFDIVGYDLNCAEILEGKEISCDEPHSKEMERAIDQCSSVATARAETTALRGTAPARVGEAPRIQLVRVEATAQSAEEKEGTVPPTRDNKNQRQHLKTEFPSSDQSYITPFSAGFPSSIPEHENLQQSFCEGSFDSRENNFARADFVDCNSDETEKLREHRIEHVSSGGGDNDLIEGSPKFGSINVESGSNKEQRSTGARDDDVDTSDNVGKGPGSVVHKKRVQVTEVCHTVVKKVQSTTTVEEEEFSVSAHDGRVPNVDEQRMNKCDRDLKDSVGQRGLLNAGTVSDSNSNTSRKVTIEETETTTTTTTTEITTPDNDDTCRGEAKVRDADCVDVSSNKSKGDTRVRETVNEQVQREDELGEEWRNVYTTNNTCDKMPTPTTTAKPVMREVTQARPDPGVTASVHHPPPSPNFSTHPLTNGDGFCPAMRDTDNQPSPLDCLQEKLAHISGHSVSPLSHNDVTSGHTTSSPSPTLTFRDHAEATSVLKQIVRGDAHDIPNFSSTCNGSGSAGQKEGRSSDSDTPVWGVIGSTYSNTFEVTGDVDVCDGNDTVVHLDNNGALCERELYDNDYDYASSFTSSSSATTDLPKSHSRQNHHFQLLKCGQLKASSLWTLQEETDSLLEAASPKPVRRALTSLASDDGDADSLISEGSDSNAQQRPTYEQVSNNANLSPRQNGRLLDSSSIRRRHNHVSESSDLDDSDGNYSSISTGESNSYRSSSYGREQTPLSDEGDIAMDQHQVSFTDFVSGLQHDRPSISRVSLDSLSESLRQIEYDGNEMHQSFLSSVPDDYDDDRQYSQHPLDVSMTSTISVASEASLRLHALDADLCRISSCASPAPSDLSEASSTYTCTGTAQIRRELHVSFQDTPKAQTLHSSKPGVVTSTPRAKSKRVEVREAPPSSPRAKLRRIYVEENVERFDKLLKDFNERVHPTADLNDIEILDTSQSEVLVDKTSSCTNVSAQYNDLYKAFTNEDVEKKQNNVCIVLEDENATPLRFKRFLRKSHTKRNSRGKKIMRFLSRLSCVSEGMKSPDLASERKSPSIYVQDIANNNAKTNYNKPEMQANSLRALDIPCPQEVNSGLFQHRNLHHTSVSPSPPQGSPASSSTQSSRTDSAYSSVSESLASTNRYPTSSASRLSTATSISGGSLSADSAFSSIAESSSRLPSEVGKDGHQADDEGEDVMGALAEVFEQLDMCQGQIDQALLNRLRHGHTRARGAPGRRL